jgi:hypothetical protein
MRALRQLLPTLLPRRQPERLLPRLVIHFVGVDLSTALAQAVDGPCTSLDLYLLGMAFVSHEERFYDGFLVVFFYQMVVVHDGRLSSFSGTFGSSQSPLVL